MSDSRTSGRILLIDDNPIVLEVISTQLRNGGHDVVQAIDGATGLREFGASTFDLVITDVMMPKVSGIDVLRHVHQANRNIPVIVLSGRSDMELVLEAIHQGAFDYVPKDNKDAPLAAAVDRALKQVSLLRENRELLTQLQAANCELEHQVAERTAQLRLTNQHLLSDRERLKEALATLQATQSRLIQAEKIASVGMLTAGVAHEINNPLAFLLPNVMYVAEWVEKFSTERAVESAGLMSEVPDVLDVLKDCSHGLERIERIVSQLRVFSRQDESKMETVNVASAIHTVLKFSQAATRHSAKIECNVDETFNVFACSSQLQQILLNILVNAARAIPDDRDGIICIDVTNETDSVAIRVTDNGVGIAQEDQAKIFEPFYTTRRGSDGTGLGLSISLELTEKMGGTLEVESEVGAGTTMILRLSTSKSGGDSVARPVTVALPKIERSPAPSRTILLLDDEEATLRALCRIFGEDYVTVCFHRGEQALGWLRSHPMPDLILCDLMMPQMTGEQFYRGSLEINPQLSGRFVFVTGGAVTSQAINFIESVDTPVVTKPFTPTQIRQLPNLVTKREQELETKHARQETL